VVLVVLSGCGNAPDCKTAVGKAFGAPKSSSMTPKIVEMCEKDSWSGDVRSCLADSKSDEGAWKCLTKVDNVNNEVMTARRDAEEARLREAEAEAHAAEAVADAKAAADKLAALEKQFADLATRVDAAVDAVVKAQTDTDRAAAKAKLAELQKQKADMEAGIAEARALATRAERMKGVKIPKRCIDNPLAVGCS